MRLKDFVTNTLIQIAEGVEDAINASQGKGYDINPSFDNKMSNTYCIRFDLSVENEVNGGANIKVLSGSMAEKSFNRISFEVNMTLPSTPQLSRPRKPNF